MEDYRLLFKQQHGPLIFPQRTYSYDFDFSVDQHRQYRLFFTGETEMFYYWKTELCSTAVYRRISDALVKGTDSAWGLKFVGADYPIMCCRKLLWKPVAAYIAIQQYTDTWRLSVNAKADNIKIRPSGYLRLSFEIRYLRDGLMKNQTKNPPDKVYTIDFPQGSYSMRQFAMDINIPTDKTANVSYILEGENFEGSIVFECPCLVSSNGYNIIPPFAPDTSMYQRFFNWLGVNLSRAEWPRMKIDINGKTIFNNEFFERCHRYSEKEIVLPENTLKNGKNHIEFTLTSDWHDALPYRLHELGIVSESALPFNIVSCPDIVSAGKVFSLLLDIKKPCSLITSSNVTAVSPLDFKEPGLAFLRLICDKEQNDLDIFFSDGQLTQNCTIKRVIERKDDDVITGTGDMVYINQDITDMRNYIKWYMQNNIGNLITIRPVYRWSGSRRVHDDTWQEMTKLFNGLGLKYSHMVDGREPQGCTANPSFDQLSAPDKYSSGFLGRQLHERDGAYCYWGTYERPDDFWNINDYYDTEQIFDNTLRQRRNNPDNAGTYFYPSDMFDDGKRYWLCHDPSLPADMEIQAKAIINSLKAIKFNATRHTGPSILFKYFCMADYDWIGAETMDSPIEFLMCALRGTARAFHIKHIGVHHALQWSSSPHDDPLRFQRYRLALYTTWMQGAHEINTEEGLWHMEECFYSHHRFSHAAKEHLKIQQDFNRYVLSHTRSGVYRARVAVLHGRYDGYPCFGGDIVWGQSKYRFNASFDAERSWQIPKLSFFPIDTRSWSAFRHFCDDKPFGLVSGNPRGCFDIVPVEKEIGDYKLLVFFAYNKAESQDLDNILERVKNGATLMLSLAHLTDTTNRSDIESYNLHFINHEIFSALGFDGDIEFTDDSFNGKSIPVACNLNTENSTVLKMTDSKYPLLIEKKVSKGKIVLLNTKLYPANPAVSELYTSTFEQLTDSINEIEYVMPVVGPDVQAAVYDQENGDFHVYFTAIDWWNTPQKQRRAALRIGKYTYEIQLPLGVMKKVYVHNDTAVWSDSEDTDIFADLTVSGYGIQTFHVAKNGSIKTSQVDFTENVRQKLEF